MIPQVLQNQRVHHFPFYIVERDRSKSELSIPDSVWESALPSKNGESHGENERLDPNTRAKGMEGGVVGVPVPGLGDREPGILRVKLRELESPPDWTPERGDEPGSQGDPRGRDLRGYALGGLGLGRLDLVAGSRVEEGRPRQGRGVELGRRR